MTIESEFTGGEDEQGEEQGVLTLREGRHLIPHSKVVSSVGVSV